jgi:hypothetical protein
MEENMSETPKKLVYDFETGETSYLDLTPEEIAQRDQDLAAFAERKALEEAEAERVDALKISAKQKLISGEPLTEEEASVIVI